MAGYIKKNNEFIPLTGDGYGLPLGTWISYEGDCPDGFIESEQTFNTTTYASLYAMLGTNKVPARFDHSVLSDWESVTISTDSNNPTIVPYEGFIHFEQSDNSNEVAEFKVYVNDVQIVSVIASSFASRRAGQGVTLPVKKGDSVYANNSVAQSKARYYKRHLAIKATPAYVEPDTVSDMVDLILKHESPDWSNAVVTSNPTQVANFFPYTVPSDGWFILTEWWSNSSSIAATVYVNNIAVATGVQNITSSGMIKVNKDDVVTQLNLGSRASTKFIFIPHK